MNFFDNLYWSIPYSWKNIYYSTRDFFNPRQKWLTQKIGNSWVDKCELIKIVAFESIIHFIEEEDAFNKIEWSATPEHAKAAEEYKRAYQYAKISIPILEEKNERLWKDKELTEYFDTRFIVPLPNQKNTKNKRYTIAKPPENADKILSKIRENKAEIERMTQEVVEILAKYRNFMWT